MVEHQPPKLSVAGSIPATPANNLMEEAQEYLDAMVVIEIAYAMARKFEESTDEAIRNCSLSVMKRLKYPRARKLMMRLGNDQKPGVSFFCLKAMLLDSGF